jgi:hypothetical protein
VTLGHSRPETERHIDRQIAYISKTTGPIGSKINMSGSLTATNILYENKLNLRIFTNVIVNKGIFHRQTEVRTATILLYILSVA